MLSDSLETVLTHRMHLDQAHRKPQSGVLGKRWIRVEVLVCNRHQTRVNHVSRSPCRACFWSAVGQRRTLEGHRQHARLPGMTCGQAGSVVKAHR